MKREDVLDLIRRGEDSGLEFKREGAQNYEIAKELVAFLNVAGGTLLLGVEDDGSISGTKQDRLDEWVAELCRKKIHPEVIPFLSWARDVEPGRHVLAVEVPAGLDKPYARAHDGHTTYYVRVGSTCREASREELERMFQASGRVNYGLKPIPGATLEDLDRRRLNDYLVRVLGGAAPDDEDVETLERELAILEFVTHAAGRYVPTVDGMLLFGKDPKRFLPQSGIRALHFPGTEPSYATHLDRDLKGALTPLRAADGSLVEIGLVEQALDFVRRNTDPIAYLEGGRRIDRPEFPESVLREAVVNALVHRDYTLAGRDVTVSLFADRLEIDSPGRLPNSVTVEGMKAGIRYARNQNLVNVMRDYGYVDFRGMGVRRKIIPGMLEHNGTEPEFVAEESRLIVRLRRVKPSGLGAWVSSAEALEETAS